LVFGHKSKLQIDLADLENEKDHLTGFLQSNLKVGGTWIQNKMVVDSETLSPQELQRVVTKFVYRRNLNSTHWVSVEGSTVKINRFKGSGKPEKEKQKKSGSPAGNITQSWGL
jgi:hypothetical protein